MRCMSCYVLDVCLCFGFPQHIGVLNEDSCIVSYCRRSWKWIVMHWSSGILKKLNIITKLSWGFDTKCEHDRKSNLIPMHKLLTLQYFSRYQAVLWMVQSVCPPVRLSVCLSVTRFWLCSLHLYRIIVEFSGVITNDGEVASMQKVKVRGERSRSQRSKPNIAVSGP